MKGTQLVRAWQAIVDALTAEFLLTKLRHRNGGAMILLRAIWSATLLYALTLLFKFAIDPTKPWRPSLVAVRKEIVATLPWFGAMFAAVYAALYARFAAQWSYLAGLYNLIKQTEATKITTADGGKAIAQWKAGFIEDAEELHLAGKLSFASVFRTWAADRDVREAYEAHTARGPQRLERLLALANEVCGDGGEPGPSPAGAAISETGPGGAPSLPPAKPSSNRSRPRTTGRRPEA
jgi:hypothetical protein